MAQAPGTIANEQAIQEEPGETDTLQPASRPASNDTAGKGRHAWKRNHSGPFPFVGSLQGRRKIILSWWREFLACLLIVATVVALLVTVHQQDGQLSRHWGLGITVNALIAIYALITKVAAGYVLANGLGQLKWTWFRSERKLLEFDVFDQASRGAQGSAVFIVTLGKGALWASFGALAVLATLIFDPFAQQLVTTISCPRAVESANGSTIRTNVYNVVPPNEIGTYQTSLNMQRAINQGFFGGPDDFSVVPSCLTGNCSFPNFDTLGFCNSCADVSHKITFTNASTFQNITISSAVYATSSATATVLPSRRQEDTNGPYILNQTYLNMTYHLPSDAGISGSGDTAQMSISSIPRDCLGYRCTQTSPTYLQLGSNGGDFYVLSGFLRGMPVEGEAAQNETNDPHSSDGSDAGFMRLPHTGCDSKNSATWPCQGKGAAVCTVKPCVQTLSTNVVNGTLLEVVLNSTVMPLNTSYPLMTIARKDCLVDNKNASLIGLGTPFGPDGSWVAFNDVVDLFGANAVADQYDGYQYDRPHDFITPVCAYTMNRYSYQGLASYLKTVFSGNVTVEAAQILNEVGQSITKSSVEPQFAPMQANPLLNQIWQRGNLSLTPSTALSNHWPTVFQPRFGATEHLVIASPH